MSGLRPSRRTFLGLSRAAESTEHTLVFVFLRGGPDGCSLAIPDDPSYRAARPSIAIPPEQTLALDDQLGLHPGFAPLGDLVTDGSLAVVPACGSMLDTRSHFEQQAFVETGGAETTAGGWLTRLLASGTDDGSELRAIAIGNGVPASYAGRSDVVALTALDDVGVAPFSNLPTDRVEEVLGELTRSAHPLVQPTSVSALATLPMLRTIVGEDADSDRAGARRRGLADQLRDVARLIRADVGVEVVTLDAGGWDTHDSMGDADGGTMSNLVGGLSDALATFVYELGDAFDRTTLVAMGEFGRRVTENGSGGTDHGRGGVLVALGGQIVGGRHGEWLGVGDDLLVKGDVPVLTDWRTVVGEIVDGPMRAEAGVVFPGLDTTFLGVTRTG